VTPTPLNACFVKLLKDPGIRSHASSIPTWQRFTAPPFPEMKKEGSLRHRPVQYLNNILEQDHRAIKRRVDAKQGFREFQAARRTIQGYEAINILRKGQVRRVSEKDVGRQNRFINQLFDLAA
jgi:IS6 family transposase